jgi:site-specific DNA-methyltransferase (adenine-specific)
VSKAIDKASGFEGEVVAKGKSWNNPESKDGDTARMNASPGEYDIKELSESAKKWEGWGTALKPAVEPIVLARKPLIGTVAQNVLTHGTGALNIDASRIGTDQVSVDNAPKGTFAGGEEGRGSDTATYRTHTGRWPANILLDEEAAAMLDEQSGGASRFFYVAKASRSERNAGLDGFDFQDAQRWSAKGGIGDYYPDGTPRPRSPERNIHPTVKPVALMKYLIRLVVPKGGVVLDPFLGSGTTAVAAIEEGVEWIGCEREPEYVEIIKARVAAAQPGMGLALEEER